jgi:hypothetical protein
LQGDRRSDAELEREAQELIDVYFELEEPSERDVVFDKIVALEMPIATAFLRAMMDEDDDELVRASAAAALATHGIPEAVARLEADLVEPEELFFFENAIAALAAIRGPAFYNAMRSIWLDQARDADERRHAMLATESVDAPRALAELESFVKGQRDMAALPDDQIELPILAFVRHAHAPGR